MGLCLAPVVIVGHIFHTILRPGAVLELVVAVHEQAIRFLPECILAQHLFCEKWLFILLLSCCVLCQSFRTSIYKNCSFSRSCVSQSICFFPHRARPYSSLPLIIAIHWTTVDRIPPFLSCNNSESVLHQFGEKRYFVTDTYYFSLNEKAILSCMTLWLQHFE